MKITKLFIRVALLMFLVPLMTLNAETLKSGAHFLQLGVGAREIAMGGVASALTNDVNALYWNPAGVSKLQTSQLGFTHAEWLLGTNYDFIGFASPSKNMGTFGLSAAYLNQGSQEGRDENRQKQSDFTASDASVALGWGSRLGSRFGVGGNLKYIQSRIENAEARTGAVDAGMQYALGSRTSSGQVGFSLRNMGPGLKLGSQKDPLPLTMALGYAKPVFGVALISTEWQYEPHDKLNHFIIGTEYNVTSFVALRAGYLNTASSVLNQSSSLMSESNGFVGGFGLSINRFSIDYAFSPFGFLGETHRFSLITRL